MPDQPANTSTTTVIKMNGAVAASVDTPTDEDWFKVTLVAGRTYQFDLIGLSGGGGTLFDPLLFGLFNSAGTFIAGTGNGSNSVPPPPDRPIRSNW